MSVSHASNSAPPAWDKDSAKAYLKAKSGDLDPKGAAEGLAATLLECVAAGAGLSDAKDRKDFLKDLVGNLGAIQSGVLDRVKNDPDYNKQLTGQFKVLREAIKDSLEPKNLDAGVRVGRFLETLEKNKSTLGEVGALPNHIQKQWEEEGLGTPADVKPDLVEAAQKKSVSKGKEPLVAEPSGTKGDEDNSVDALLQATSSLAEKTSGAESTVFGQLHNIITEQVKAQ